MASDTQNGIPLSDWLVLPDQLRLKHKTTGKERKVEHKQMSLLLFLMEHQGETLEKERLLSHVWPGVVVADDTLARAVSRLRKSLDDTKKPHRYIETIPKLGYRLRPSQPQSDEVEKRRQSTSRITLVSLVVGLAIIASVYFGLTQPNTNDGQYREILDRADGFYMQFSQESNESAALLYESVLEEKPDDAQALAGLANTQAQRALRWPENQAHPTSPSIRSALSSGQLDTPEATSALAIAQAHAERALRLAPEEPTVIKALALVYSAQGKLDQAKSLYQEAISIDHQAWRSLINLAEIHLIEEQPSAALQRFEAAYKAMQSRYDSEPHLVGPWQPDLGAAIAQLHEQLGNKAQALRWYREVLSKAPRQPEALAGKQRLEEESR